MFMVVTVKAGCLFVLIHNRRNLSEYVETRPNNLYHHNAEYCFNRSVENWIVEHNMSAGGQNR